MQDHLISMVHTSGWLVSILTTPLPSNALEVLTNSPNCSAWLAKIFKIIYIDYLYIRIVKVCGKVVSLLY